MICFVLSTEVLVLHKPHLLHKVVSSFTLRLPENIIFRVLLRAFAALLSVQLRQGSFANFARGSVPSVSTCKSRLVHLNHRLLGLDT